jgi:benzoyl-CoA 2,3-dioxygenase component B
MLTEEAHHMFVGETGVGRVIKRSLEVMTEIGTDDPVAIRQQGAVDLETLQRYLNFWFTSSLDLFGSEISSNAAMSFASGIKGRPDEGRYEDHLCNNATYDVDTPEGMEKVNLRNAMNDVTRGAYVKDCEIGIKRWNMMIKRAKHDVTLSLPSTRVNRPIGSWANVPTDPNGQKISQADFDKKKSNWLPTESDQSFIRSLMQCVNEPGKMAGWIAPPDRGINNNPVDYEYVRLK